MAGRGRGWLAIAAVVAAGLVLTLAIEERYHHRVLTLVFLWAAMGLAWNIISGYAGQISFGHQVFFGIGAYVTVLLVVKAGLTPWIGMVVAMAVAVLAAIGRLVRPGGDVICSTINRNPKAFALAIVGAEYLLRLLPMGTHRYARLIRPSELARWARGAGLELLDLAGLEYNPATRRARISADASVNYLAHFRRPMPAGPA